MVCAVLVAVLVLDAAPCKNVTPPADDNSCGEPLEQGGLGFGALGLDMVSHQGLVILFLQWKYIMEF